MNENDIYGVWLQQAVGEGSRKVPQLLMYFGSCKGVYEADEQELRLSGILGERELFRFLDTRLEVAEEIIDACRRLDYSILTPDSENYPERLRNIPDYPAALYICGELPDIDNEVCISMVGTRRASRYGYTTATAIAKDLAAAGAVVISGCARGIDSAAHQGTLLSGGKTIAVLGCGINTRYNMDNEGLRKVISTSGALVSEYPPGAPALSFHFPIRNRIISALSLGVIVVEAGEKSGSLITANIALEQGKDIFSVPGAINTYQAKGTNRLIFDGATPIESAADVLCEYVGKFPGKLNLANLKDPDSRAFEKHVRPKWDRDAIAARYGITPEQLPDPAQKNGEQKQTADSGGKQPSDKQQRPDKRKMPYSADESVPPVGMSEEAQRVWRALNDVPKHFRELSDELGMDSDRLSRCLTELELYSAVRALPGNKYSKG